MFDAAMKMGANKKTSLDSEEENRSSDSPNHDIKMESKKLISHKSFQSNSSRPNNHPSMIRQHSAAAFMHAMPKQRYNNNSDKNNISEKIAANNYIVEVDSKSHLTQNWDDAPALPGSLYTYSIMYCVRELQLSKNKSASDWSQYWAVFVIIPQIFVVAFVQFVILYELWDSLPYLSDSPFCSEWNAKMMFSVILSFVASLMPSFYGT